MQIVFTVEEIELFLAKDQELEKQKQERIRQAYLNDKKSEKKKVWISCDGLL